MTRTAQMEAVLLWIANMAEDEAEHTLERRAAMLAKAGRRARSCLALPPDPPPSDATARPCACSECKDEKATGEKYPDMDIADALLALPTLPNDPEPAKEGK